MEVRLKPLGCVGQLGAVLSLGLLPIVQRRQFRQFPGQLTDDAMVLRNGARIPWNSLTGFKATDLYVQGIQMNTQYELWHKGGRVHFTARQIQDIEAVVTFILRHLPPGAAERGGP
jgi:hypothetical protein